MNSMQKITHQENQAINYIEQKVKPKAQADSFGIQGLWQEAVLNYLKKQALNYVGQALVHLRKRAINKLVDLSDWLLGELEDYLLKLYQQSPDEEEREIFQKKIEATFPNSRLAQKLKGGKHE